MPDSIDVLVERLLNGDEVSRRMFVRRISEAGLLVGGGGLLAACGGVEGTKKTKTSGASVDVKHPKTEITQLNFANWPLYIDEETVDEFEKEFGGKVRYTEEINDNEEFFAKVRQELESGRAIGRDIVVLTDWMAGRWIDSGYTEPIDEANVPNRSNLLDSLASPPFDPQRDHSLPWQSGMIGLGYDVKRTGRKLTSVADFFDPKFKGRVSLLKDARDTANLMLLLNGVKPEDAKIDDILAAIEKVKEENDKGQIRRFTGNDYTTDLAKGNLWVAMAYSGDIVQLQADNPNLEFVIPEEGATLWSDNMLIPKKAAHPYAAETMMNYVYDPEVAARIAAYVNYVTPVKGVKEILAKEEPELAENELIFPSDETLTRLHPYPTISSAEERQMNAAMADVTGG